MPVSKESQVSGKLSVIGYRGLRHPQFFNILREHEVQILLDVRRNPYSPNPDYQKESLSVATEAQAIRYFHLPQLGVPGAGHSTIPIGQPETFADQMATQEAKKALLRIVTLLRKGYNLTLMCAEPDYRTCHRAELVRLLKKIDPTIELEELTGKPAKTLFDLVSA